MNKRLSLRVLGAGAWGSALAHHLCQQGHQVTLWTHSAEQCVRLLKERRFTHLNEVRLHADLRVVADLSVLMEEPCDGWLVAVPSHAFETTLRLMKPYVRSQHRLIWATKGFEPKTQRLLTDVFAVHYPEHVPAVLSGPSFAQEVALALPTAVVCASTDLGQHDVWVQALRAPHFRIYTSHDVVGVQVGGLVKNVIAVAAGISEGLGHGHNAQAALVTRALVEMRRLASVMGAEAETVHGLSGLGDLMLTCTGSASRNRRFGLLLGQGLTAEQALQQVGQVVEGMHNALALQAMTIRLDVEMPIVREVAHILSGDQTPEAAMAHLLERSMKAE